MTSAAKLWTSPGGILLALNIGMFSLLGGCSLFSSDPSSAIKEQLTVAATCKAIGLSLKDLAPFRPRMDAKAQGVVAEVLAVTDPVCTAPTAPTSTQVASTALVAAAGRLSTVLALFK